MRKLYLLIAALTAMMLGVASTAAAVEYGGIGGRPANPQPNNPRTQSIFIYQLKPGQQATDGIRLYNNTNKPQTISVYAVDSVLSSGGAFACAQNADPKHDVGAWIKLQANSAVLAANTSQTVPFTVTVPTNAGVGEHDGCIAIQAATQTATKSSKSGVVLSFRSAIRMVVTIPGKIVKKLTITSVKVSRAKDGNYLVAPAARNDGNVSLDTTTQVKLISVLGTSLAPVKEGTSPVLPDSEASWNYEVKRPFWGGFYRARMLASYNSDPSTELGVNQNANQKTEQLDSVVFFAAPTVAAGLLEAAVVLVVAGVVAWFVRKRFHANHVRRHWRAYTIEEGDTLHSLAKDFGVSWKQIAKVNKLKPPYELRKDQKLKLPTDKG